MFSRRLFGNVHVARYILLGLDFIFNIKFSKIIFNLSLLEIRRIKAMVPNSGVEHNLLWRCL